MPKLFLSSINFNPIVADTVNAVSQQNIQTAAVANPFNPDIPSTTKSVPIGSIIDKFQLFKNTGFRSVRKRVQPDFERFAKNYAKDEPEILFVSEYIVDDELIGVLVVWEKYYDSTHYEVFKKNTFQAGSRFERILFLDIKNLAEERTNFMPYIKDVLGFEELEEENIYIMLDDHIKEDRIYEYKIKASRVPKDAKEIDYDLILDSKKLLNVSTLDINSTTDLFSFAGSTLGSKDLAWTLSLVNETVKFFGRGPIERPLSKFIPARNNEIKIYVPKDLNDVLCIIKESLSLFDVKDIFEHLVSVLGGLPLEFKTSVLNSVDNNKNIFSYDKFQEEIKQKVPIFNLILNIAESEDSEAVKQLSALSIIIPNNEGSETLTSLVGLSRIFKFVNENVITILYAQEKDTFEKVLEIQQDIEERREQAKEDALNEAMREMREEIADKIDKSADSDVSNFFGIQVGSQSDDQEDADDTGGDDSLPGFRVL